MATSDPVRARALAALREGRVTVLGVKLDEQWRPVHVLATVRSSRENVRPHRVRFVAGRWSCTCPESTVADGVTRSCPHSAAVALVTVGVAA